MKKLLLTFAALSLIASTTVAQDDAPWFDMPNCAICKNMVPIMDSMHMIKWDPHTTAYGMLSITVVPDELKEKWGKAKSGMDSTIKKLNNGEQMKCCGFCQSMGKLIEAGAKKEEIKTAGGDIMLLTSDNPTVVKQIHEHVKKTEAEHAKMQKMMPQQQGNATK